MRVGQHDRNGQSIEGGKKHSSDGVQGSPAPSLRFLSH